MQKATIGLLAATLAVVGGTVATAGPDCSKASITGFSVIKEKYPDGGTTGSWVGTAHGTAPDGKGFVEGDVACKSAKWTDMDAVCAKEWKKAYCK